ncbi:ribonuclease H-like domain-containing protein [Tanacetum coccineum]
MDLKSTQNNALAKLPLLKQGDYDTWRLRIESYIQLQDYALWEIIEDGNSFKPVARTTTNVDGTSTSIIPGAVTADEKIQKKNDLKAQSILMMTLPSEHLLTFNQYKDAKTLFEAIKARFGGNEATKKTQKTLLKQIQLAILGENISQEDLNFKFLRRLPSEWSMHVVVWRNKPDLGSISFDDLYNNFKIVEQEVKRSVISSSNSSSQNVAFVSTPISTNDVNTSNVHVSTASSSLSDASTTDNTARLSDAIIYAFLANQPNGSQVVHEDLEKIHEDDLEEMDLKCQLALLSMKARKFYQITGKKIIINGSDIAGYDKTKVECFNCHKMGHFTRECGNPRSQENRSRNQDSSRRTVNVEETSSKAMLAIDRVGFDWSFMSEDKTPTNFALMAFSDSEVHNNKTCSKTCLKSFEDLKSQYDNLRIKLNKSEFDLANYKRGLASVEEQLVFYKKNKGILCDQIVVLKRDASFNESEINALKIQIERLKKEKESLFAPSSIDLSNSGLEEFKQPKFEGYEVKMVQKPVLNNVKKETGQREVRPVWNNAMRTNHQNFSNTRRNFAPTAVLTKPGLVPISAAKQSFSRTATIVSAARPIKTVAPKPFANSVNATKGKRVTSDVGEQGIDAVKSKACWV